MRSRARIIAMPALLATTALALALPVPFAYAETADPPSISDGADSEQVLTPRTASGSPVWSAVPEAAQSTPPAARESLDAAAAEVPGQPIVSQEELTATSARFSWSAANGGSPITAYVVRLSMGGTVIDEATWTQGTTVWITELEPETGYEFSVAAVNAVGTGAFSEPYMFSTTFDFVERQFGLNRFETAARVSYRAFPFSGIEAAFLANGLNFPDALAGAAAAGSLGGPVLLTEPGTLPTASAQELAALAPDYLLVPGGTASVRDKVMSQAAASATIDALRLAGSNRFGTAAQVSTLWDPTPVVYLANGMDFPDALAGAAAAGAHGAPVLLTEKDKLPAETRAAIARLKPSKIVVLGGTGSVAASVVTKAVAASGVATTAQRLAGQNRYDTAVAISKGSFPNPGVPVVYVASAASFADALAGAAAAGHRGGPVLLTERASAPASVLKEIARLKPQRIVVLGGPTIVSDRVMAQLEDAAR